MPSTHEGATVVVRIADAGRERLVLARITSRRGECDMEVGGPSLITAEELASTVSGIVARLAREIAGGPDR